ncbi:MAG TPA: cofactor-independent phosphoglycerate mutase [Candidatus Omnitrophota bacterium]|nr:cofactor-independent phosphoglycerate mutase [Candidatus Omnitrophota bacterium]HPD85229.1 cofactor-independent phosphoglycerate mutase [Candidatus Omnitrophota bacterium]HRZ04270.1 cofactor-independent phosphoglycerate mutase [Candidatus Omnitrophota bacterium]
MKYIVLVPDGMADYPLADLGGRTPLQVANKPNMDFIAQNGLAGLVQTIPDKMPPGSEIGNLALMGYDPATCFSGRAPLEAANLGIELNDNEVAFRCNLVTIENQNMADYSAGHISHKEASVLIDTLNQHLKTDAVRFHAGKSYRHLMVVKTDDPQTVAKIKCTPPHDIMGQEIKRHLPQGKHAEILLSLMERSRDILNNHSVNQVRIDLKENPANMIWLWGQGQRPSLTSFSDKFGVKGSVISAVDLINGIGKLIKLNVVTVPGITGYYDTNYLGKAQYALDSLKKNDFVFVHVEATDEAGHNGDIRMKITCIERFDKDVVGTVLKHFKGRDDFRILVVPDHATPIEKRTHTSDPVCFCMLGNNISKDGISEFNEATAKEKGLKFPSGEAMMEYFMRKI